MGGEECVPTPCTVVIAKGEYEAWFLATIELWRGQRGICPDATSTTILRSCGAKEQLEERLEAGLRTAKPSTKSP